MTNNPWELKDTQENCFYLTHNMHILRTKTEGLNNAQTIIL